MEEKKREIKKDGWYDGSKRNAISKALMEEISGGSKREIEFRIQREKSTRQRKQRRQRRGRRHVSSSFFFASIT